MPKGSSGSSIEVHVLREDVDKILAHAHDVEKGSHEGLEKALAFVHENLPPTPPASKKPFPFVSEKQRLFVIRAIREGTIKVPYRRTNTMVRKITTEVKKLGSEYVGIIGTAVPYAPWVMSTEEVPGLRAGPQAKYHKNVWWTLQNEVKKHRDEIIKFIEKGIGKYLKK